MRYLCGLLLVLAAWTALPAREGCTVAVISAKATADGRPLLWKNRDSSERNNEVAFFRGPGYDFLGVINAGDTTQVWMGVNTAGLAIMNSESMDQPGDSADTEGFFMKEALGSCGRLRDVEALLRRTNNAGRGTRANFGVIDAFGGAAFFETGNISFVRMDADDTTLCKDGILVRANFSFTGQGPSAYGGWRYQHGLDMLRRLAHAGQLSHEELLKKVCRDLVNDEVDPYPLPFSGRMNHEDPGWLDTQNSINRHRTVSCAVFHGVAANESPSLTTMWCMLGEPICSIAIPLWAVTGPVSDMLDGTKKSPLNLKMQGYKNWLYHDREKPRYLDTRRLTGARSFLERQQRMEEEIFSDTRQRLKQWRNSRPDVYEVQQFQNEIIKYVMRRY
jgi:hypothetical protein